MTGRAERNIVPASAILTAFSAALVVSSLSVEPRAEVEGRQTPQCPLSGPHRLTKSLRVYTSCLGDGGSVTALPAGADVVVDEYPAACERSKVGVFFEERWFYAAVELLRESFDACASTVEADRLEQAADILARACLRGEVSACRALRQQEKRAAAAALKSSPPSSSPPESISAARPDKEASDDDREEADEAAAPGSTPPQSEQEPPSERAPVITTKACILRSEASLYGEQVRRLEKGSRCERADREAPYVKVVCGSDEGWAIEGCFEERPLEPSR